MKDAIHSEEPAAIEKRFDLTEPLALSLANTVTWRHGVERSDELGEYADLVAFARAADLIGAGRATALLRTAASRPTEAKAVFTRAIDLREALYRLFAAVAAGHPPAGADLALLNEHLAGALAPLRLARQGAGFAWTWDAQDDTLDQVWWPIVRQAAELLTSGERAQVRECGGETCGWLFLDRSRSGRRQWCDMRVCGNRAKARRHYARIKQQQAGADSSPTN